MNKDTTLETVNEDLVFSKPIADNKVDVDVFVNETSILDARADVDSTDIRTDAADSVVSFVDTSNASIAVVDLSNGSTSIIDNSNYFIDIPIADISKNEPIKSDVKEIIRFSEPSTIELIENSDQKKFDSDIVTYSYYSMRKASST